MRICLKFKLQFHNFNLLTGYAICAQEKFPAVGAHQLIPTLDLKALSAVSWKLAMLRS